MERTRNTTANAAKDPRAVPVSNDHMQPALGQRLRELREARGLSLAEASAGAQISRSFLSLVEKGRNEMTIGRLARLVAFYGIHVGDFLSGNVTENPYVVRSAERRTIPSHDERTTYFVLTPDDDRSMLPMFVEFGSGGGLAEEGRHPGEEFLYIVEGSLELRIEGESWVTLSAGDSAWIPPGLGHDMRNTSSDPTTLISVVNPPNM